MYKLLLLLLPLILIVSAYSAEAGADVKAVSEKEFKTEVLDSKIPVFVDFWAPWCGPCRMVGPIVEELAKKHKGKMKFVKVNVDDAPKLSAQYKITGIPMMAVFKNGKIAEQVMGAYPKDELDRFIVNQLK